VFVDPGSDALYRFTHYMDAYETLQKAFPGTEVGYSTRDGLVRFYRSEIENEAIRVF
jgi:hypothetical protein